MAHVEWTFEARKWLKTIYSYLSEFNKETAKKVIVGIIKQVKLLADFPELGHRLMNWPEDKLHMILYGHYKIVYRIISNERIDILGIYHSAMDFEKHFNN